MSSSSGLGPLLPFFPSRAVVFLRSHSCLSQLPAPRVSDHTHSITNPIAFHVGHPSPFTFLCHVLPRAVMSHFAYSRSVTPHAFSETGVRLAASVAFVSFLDSQSPLNLKLSVGNRLEEEASLGRCVCTVWVVRSAASRRCVLLLTGPEAEAFVGSCFMHHCIPVSFHYRHGLQPPTGLFSA